MKTFVLLNHKGAYCDMLQVLRKIRFDTCKRGYLNWPCILSLSVVFN